MSRWKEAFISHPFQSEWRELKTELESARVDDPTVIASVQELARLKRVVVYIDSIISSIDYELTPMSIWENFHQQTKPCLLQVREFVKDREISHIREANSNADNLLAYVKPYLVTPKAAIVALKASSIAYGLALESAILGFKNSVGEAATEIKDSAPKAAAQLVAIKHKRETAEKYLFQLTEGDTEHPSTKSFIDNLVNRAETQSTAISKYYKELLENSNETESIKSQIEAAKMGITATNSTIDDLFETVRTKTEDLKKFHTDVFGTTNKDDTEALGLKHEIDTKLTQINDLTTSQKTKYDALFKRIEDALPGATSAGLASSYGNLKTSFDLPIRYLTGLFFIAIAMLVIGAMFMVTKELTFTPFKIVLDDIPEWSVIFKSILFRAPFIAPIIWLAIFASTRRDQYARLKQEYAHKEALATSYDSYKKQIKDLGEPASALMQQLIQSTIDAITFNASTTLDIQHAEKVSTQDLIKNLTDKG